MSVIPDHDFERLARLLMRGDEKDDLLSKIVRLLRMDDDACDDQPEARSINRQCKPSKGFMLN
jgi:hypothetical protein